MTEPHTPANGGAGSRASRDAKGVRPLAPELDPSRWETLVARIVSEARPLLEARRRRHPFARTLADWRRPVMVGAGALAAAAVATLFLLPGGDPAPVEAAFDEVVVPWSVAAWMDGSHTPTVEELVLAMEEYSP